jgi:hypothetical protein
MRVRVEVGPVTGIIMRVRVEIGPVTGIIMRVRVEVGPATGIIMRVRVEVGPVTGIIMRVLVEVGPVTGVIRRVRVRFLRVVEHLSDCSVSSKSYTPCSTCETKCTHLFEYAMTVNADCMFLLPPSLLYFKTAS